MVEEVLEAVAAEVEVREDINNLQFLGVNVSNTTPCIRCGKLRIAVKTWKEEIRGSFIIHTETSCPDSDCQTIVEGELKKKMDKVKIIQQKALDRRKLNRRNKK